MIKKNNQTIGAVYKGTTEISKIMKGTTLLYENWQTLTAQGVPPLTLNKCKGTDLLDYQVYGQSIQEANLVDNNKIIASSISSGKISIGLTGLTVQDSYQTSAFLMSDLFEPNTTYYIHCERVYSTTRTNATGRIYSDGELGILLNFNVDDGKFTTGDTVSGYLYLYGFASGTVDFNNLYIGRLPYTQYEAHKVPSPTTPIEVQSVGDLVTDTQDENYGKYEIPITTSGFNIWDEQWELGYWNSSGQKASASTAIRCANKIPILEYTTYYIKCGNPNGLMVRFLDSNDTPLLSQYTTNTVITAPRNSISMVFYTNTADNIKTYNNDICINISNTTLNGTYQAYTAPTTTNIYLDAPLRKIGNVSDYIDFENSKVVRNIDEYTFTGSETYVATSYTDLFWVSFTNYNNGGFCNYFDYLRGAAISGNASAASSLSNNQISFRLGTTKDRVYIKSNQFVLAEDLKTWITQNNVVLCYILNTETEQTITLPSIPSIKGITVYIVGTNIQPSNMYVKYKGKN